MHIISKVFGKLNMYFLHDSDETAPLSDYLIFYGINGGAILISILFLIKIITF